MSLEIVDVSVAYGGNKAVSNVSLHAPLGRITGLIGPNGAGKTTTFNACSGLLRPTTGTVRLNERDITHRPPSARARMGLGRTFQRMELVNAMTVRVNVGLGAECPLVGLNAIRQVFSAFVAARHIYCSSAPQRLGGGAVVLCAHPARVCP